MTGPTRRSGRGHSAGGRSGGGEASAGSPRPAEERDTREVDWADKPRRMQRLGDLLPQTVREFGLEDQFDQARAAASWLDVVAERVPAAAGQCRLVELKQGVATIEADQPIVAQEIRLRSAELLAAWRATVSAPIRQLRVTTRHV